MELILEELFCSSFLCPLIYQSLDLRTKILWTTQCLRLHLESSIDEILIIFFFEKFLADSTSRLPLPHIRVNATLYDFFLNEERSEVSHDALHEFYILTFSHQFLPQSPTRREIFGVVPFGIVSELDISHIFMIRTSL
jgi:hypothetical protein